jgi:hypothetical protein
MYKITLSGIIEKGYADSFPTIKLIQEDGYKIDLVGRFREAIQSVNNISVQVSYWLSDKRCTKNEMTEEWLKKISGYATAEYEASSYQYSSWTSGTDYDTVLKIGNHDLLVELQGQEGKFIILELNLKDHK